MPGAAQARLPVPVTVTEVRGRLRRRRRCLRFESRPGQPECCRRGLVQVLRVRIGLGPARGPAPGSSRSDSKSDFELDTAGPPPSPGLSHPHSGWQPEGRRPRNSEVTVLDGGQAPGPTAAGRRGNVTDSEVECRRGRGRFRHDHRMTRMAVTAGVTVAAVRILVFRWLSSPVHLNTSGDCAAAYSCPAI